MDKKQNSKIRMHRAVSGILESNQQIVSETPGLHEGQLALDGFINETTEYHREQSNNGTELTTEKNNVRQKLNTSFKMVSRALLAYATNSKDPKEKLLKEKHKYTDSDIEKMKEKDIFSKAYILYGDALPLASKLSPFTTENDVAQLKENADEFNFLLPQKRVQLSKSSTSTQNLEDAIAKTDELIKDTIDSLINPFEFSFPDFFRSYKNARIIIDPAYRKRKTDVGEEGSK